MALTQDDKVILLEYAQKLGLGAEVLPAFDDLHKGVDWCAERVDDIYTIHYLEHGYIVQYSVSAVGQDEFLLAVFRTVAQRKALEYAYGQGLAEEETQHLYHAKLKEYLVLLNPAWGAEAEKMRLEDLEGQAEYEKFADLDKKTK
jgi:hypothetical protein